MSDNEILMDYKRIEAQLIDKSNKLNISLDDLVERYIRRGLFSDDYYEPPELTREEVIEIFKKSVEKDRKNGIPPMKHDFSYFVGLLNKLED